MSPSTAGSSLPVTVMVCGVFQLAAVKVRVVMSSVPSVSSKPEMVTVTSAVGALSRTTSKVLVPAASVVMRLPLPSTLLLGVMVIAGVSSSWLMTEMVAVSPL